MRERVALTTCRTVHFGAADLRCWPGKPRPTDEPGSRWCPADALRLGGRQNVELRPGVIGRWHAFCVCWRPRRIDPMYSILYIIGAIVVIIVVLKLLGLY